MLVPSRLDDVYNHPDLIQRDKVAHSHPEGVASDKVEEFPKSCGNCRRCCTPLYHKDPK